MARIPTRRCVLVEPAKPTGETDSFGHPVVGDSETEHRLWVRRTDRGGTERIAADTFVADSQVRLDAVAASVPKSIDTDWYVKFGTQTFDIVAIAEAEGGIPGNILWIYCRRRT